MGPLRLIANLWDDSWALFHDICADLYFSSGDRNWEKTLYHESRLEEHEDRIRARSLRERARYAQLGEQ